MRAPQPHLARKRYRHQRALVPTRPQAEARSAVVGDVVLATRPSRARRPSSGFPRAKSWPLTVTGCCIFWVTTTKTIATPKPLKAASGRSSLASECPILCPRRRTGSLIAMSANESYPPKRRTETRSTASETQRSGLDG